MRAHVSVSFLLGFGLYLALGASSEGDGISEDYSHILSPDRDKFLIYEELPGFTRSVYAQDHALITPESRVWQPLAGWENAVTAHLISPANGAAFTMYLVDARAASAIPPAPAELERFIFILDGAINMTSNGGKLVQELHPDSFAYFPAGDQHRVSSVSGAGMVVFERVWSKQGKPAFRHGQTSEATVQAVPGEVFALRKLLPATVDYDFNIHIMDFRPGESLNIKEVHYNQHGLLLLLGKGIYRLADKWYPVQSGDAVWMAPYVIQWYAALGNGDSRYILYKDTTTNPALHGVTPMGLAS